MMKRKLALAILISCLFVLYGCTGKQANSTFNIWFIDVGQGDAALIECDGHYMLIDGGDESAGDSVKNILIEQNVTQIDILAISHLHADHYAGLTKALTYVSTIKKTISNSTYSDGVKFETFEKELKLHKTSISVPNEGDSYKLGSASVKVVDVNSKDYNAALVLLIEYGENKFLFTGDIEEKGQKRISNKYGGYEGNSFKVDLIKMPHHGSDKSEKNNEDSMTGSLYVFLRTFMPDYAIISVGEGNPYGHPGERTISELRDLGAKVYRTDIDGTVIVKSNGKDINISTRKY